MALIESSNATVFSKSAPPKSSSAEQSMSSTPASDLLTMSAQTASTNTSPADMAHVPHHTTALVPAGPSQLAATNASAGQLLQTSMPQNLHEGDDAWLLVTRSLMVAVMQSKPPATATRTLLGVFQPMVDGWAAAQKESKSWKERAEMHIAEHHKHRTEHAQKHDNLQAQVQRLQESLAESEDRVRELEFQKSKVVAKVSSLEETIGAVEAEAQAAKEAHAGEKQQRQKETEAMAKSAQEAKSMYEQLRQQTENTTLSHSADIIKTQDRIKEMEAMKTKLNEQLRLSIANNTSLQQQLAQKGQDIASLQTRVTELTAQKKKLERQITIDKLPLTGS